MSLEERLEKIESLLVALVEREQTREWYTTKQFANRVCKAEFTVRNWCRLGRVNAKKRVLSHGSHDSWVISHTEFLRFQQHGLLPVMEHKTASEKAM